MAGQYFRDVLCFLMSLRLTFDFERTATGRALKSRSPSIWPRGTPYSCGLRSMRMLRYVYLSHSDASCSVWTVPSTISAFRLSGMVRTYWLSMGSCWLNSDR